jgi:hypothetical protein
MNSETSKPAKAGKDSSTLVTVTEVAEQVGREILDSRLEPGAWATALYECGGRRQEALAMYARLRVRKLTKQRRIRLAKVKSFESRRLAHCMGDQATRELLAKTIQEMLNSSRRGQSQNFLKPRISVLWLFILFVGTAGTVASLGRLYSSYLPENMANPVTMLAMLAGVASVWGALVLRLFLPKRWIMLGWNTGLVVTCNVLCLSSLFLGTKVIKRAIATGTVVFPVHQVSATPAPTPTVKKPVEKEKPYLVSTGSKKRSLEN